MSPTTKPKSPSSGAVVELRPLDRTEEMLRQAALDEWAMPRPASVQLASVRAWFRDLMAARRST